MGAEGKNILVFVSYATKDAKLFKIKKIAEELTKYKDIDDVLYWQEDLHDNIFKYMSDNLGKCDVMLLFCSPNALNSVPVEKEWTAADAMGKPIIPIFMKTEYIPPLLISRLGVEFDLFDFQKNLKSIYKLVLKKVKLPRKASVIKISRKKPEEIKIILFGNSDTYVILHKLLDFLNENGFNADIDDYNRPNISFYKEFETNFKGNEKYYLKNQIEFNPNTVTEELISNINNFIVKKLNITLDRVIKKEYLDRDICIILDRKEN